MRKKTVSVVIPSYNRAELLKNALFSLKHQTFPKSAYEVIVVDDGSTDHTLEMLRNCSWDLLRVITSNQNKGAAAARNRGIHMAEGELVLFVDSDFVVPSGFIEAHVRTHAGRDRSAVSGMGHWHFLLTYDFQDQWADYQRRDLADIYNRPEIRYRTSAASPYLMTEADILTGNFAPFLVYPEWLKSWMARYGEIIGRYGETMRDFRLPWLSFCTGNVSVDRDLLLKLGGFDETFRRHEDWDLGYRLYKEGCVFQFSIPCEAYQQLSPIPRGKYHIEHETYRELCRKHPAFEIYLLALFLRERTSPHNLSKLMYQHQKIKRRLPAPLIQAFEAHLLHYSAGGPPPSMPLQRESPLLNSFRKQRQYGAWIRLYDKLASLDQRLEV